MENHVNDYTKDLWGICCKIQERYAIVVLSLGLTRNQFGVTPETGLSSRRQPKICEMFTCNDDNQIKIIIVNEATMKLRIINIKS